jgi:predicted kinase
MGDHSETETARKPADNPATPVLGDETELLAVCGFPGVGKSTVSAYLTDTLDGTRLRTDEVRKELFPDPTYSTSESITVYKTACERAREALADGQTVVLDASFATDHYRDLAETVATECDVPFRLVRVACDEQEVLTRIRRRDGISDADVEVYYKIKESFEPLERDHVTIDNSGAWDETVTTIESYLP